MPHLHVTFEYRTGLHQDILRRPRLMGSWDGQGRFSGSWSTVDMEPFAAEDGCPAWRATVALNDEQRGWWFHWGVVADTPGRSNVWAISTEVNDAGSSARQCDFQLDADGQVERYWLADSRRLGANKHWAGADRPPAIRFAVWAPNAQQVETVFGDPGSGYIWSDGRGVQDSVPMDRGADGVWRSRLDDPRLQDFKALDHRPYMFRVTRDDGSVAYRTDPYSRCQIGSGRKNPEHPEDGDPPWNGTRQDVSGVRSCSVVIDPEQVTGLFAEGVWPETEWVSSDAFWANEFDPLNPVPTRIEDLVIYELHVTGLGAGRNGPGTLADAIALLDHLVDLGVNAVELMPVAGAEDWSWGYGTSHHFAIEFSGGGRDQMKYFVRACHRRGIAVILDVVYNHWIHDAERSQWMFDSQACDRQIYYWYEGRPSDWKNPSGGFLDNGSSGWTPNFKDLMVRRLFVSSAATLVSEFHIDGFRVDLTDAIHRNNRRSEDQRQVGMANQFGQKLLREWIATLKLIKPSVMVVAEDYSDWPAITMAQDRGGIGFDAIWWVKWYHHLIGDSQSDPSYARLLHVAGPGGDGPLAMDYLAGALQATGWRVIYHESHDQAGNATYQEGGQEQRSARTIAVAVNGALEGNRFWAEARCRVASGLTLLAGGTPMFFMGEEVGARELYTYQDFLAHREDFTKLRASTGANLFRFYQDAIRLRRSRAAFRSPNHYVAHVHNDNRVIAFTRWRADEQYLVVASLNNHPFETGYVIGNLPDGVWREILNSDAALYGGADLHNPGTVATRSNALSVRLPANGLLVLQLLSEGTAP